MPQNQLQRYEQILVRMISRLVARTDLSDIADSSTSKHLQASFARETDEVYYQMDRLKDLWSIDKAAGTDLEERAKDIQPATLQKLSARKAVTTIVFSRTGTTGDVTIPAGTIVKTTDKIAFITDIAATILDTTTTATGVSATAQLAGAAGNVASGTLIKFGAKIPGVDAVTNSVPGAQGRDKESDSAFRQRLKAFVRALAKCNPSAQEFGVIGVTSGTKEIVFSHMFEDPVNPSLGTLYIDDGLGTAEESDNRSGDILATDTFTFTAGPNTVQLDVVGANFTEALVGDDIIIVGSTSNDGTHAITEIVSDTSIKWVDAGGVTEAGAGKWGISEVVIASALGGEEYLYTDKKPIKSEAALTVTSDTRGALTLGSTYYFNAAAGRLYFTPALAVGEKISIAGTPATPTGYTYFTGLIAAAQKVVDGDENDRTNYPGYRAGGTIIRVLTPTVVIVSVQGTLNFVEGVNTATVLANVENAVLSYINNLGISGDVIRHEIIERVMAVDGVFDLILTTPVANTNILDNEIARATAAGVTIT